MEHPDGDEYEEEEEDVIMSREVTLSCEAQTTNTNSRRDEPGVEGKLSLFDVCLTSCF